MRTDRRTENGQQTLENSHGIQLRASVARCLSTLFGMPDYARYLAHQRRCHPEAPVLSEKEFVRVELERKYAGGGARCC